MKTISKIFISVFLLSVVFVGFVHRASAAALTTSGVTATSVAIGGGGFSANTGYLITLSSLPVAGGHQVSSSSTGSFSTSFSGLTPNTAYTIFIQDPSSNYISAPGNQFTTLAAIPTLTFTASPTTITSGQSSVLSWTSTFATACTGGGDWFGAQSLNGPHTVNPTVTSTYSLTCTGPGGSASAAVTITIGTGTPPPPPPPPSPSPSPTPTPGAGGLEGVPTPPPAPVTAPPVDLGTMGGGWTVACPPTGCGFNELLATVNKVVRKILEFSIYIAALMFVYAGFIMITAGGESAHAREKAKKIALGVVKGIFFIAACYLIVRLILITLGYTNLGFIF